MSAKINKFLVLKKVLKKEKNIVEKLIKESI